MDNLEFLLFLKTLRIFEYVNSYFLTYVDNSVDVQLQFYLLPILTFCQLIGKCDFVNTTSVVSFAWFKVL